MSIEPLSFWGGLSWHDGRVIDVHHPDHGRAITGTVLVMSGGRGSSSASVVMAEVIRRGTGPAAVVVRTTDLVLLVGALVAAELYGLRCPVVELDRAAFDRVAALNNTRLVVDAEDETAIISIAPA